MVLSEASHGSCLKQHEEWFDARCLKKMKPLPHARHSRRGLGNGMAHAALTITPANKVANPLCVPHCGGQHGGVDFLSECKEIVRHRLTMEILMQLQKRPDGDHTNVVLIDHYPNSFSEFFLETQPRAFSKTTLLLVNNDEERCENLQSLFSKHPNVKVECGDFAQIVRCSDTKFHIAWEG